MALEHFILPEMHFKANFFFSLWPPLTHPTTKPRDYQGGESKFLDHVFFPLRGVGGWVRTLMEKSINFFLNHPRTQPRNYQRGESKRGEWGLIKVRN